MTTIYDVERLRFDGLDLNVCSPVAGTNLVTNPSFEVDTAGWGPGSGTPVVTRELIWANTGAYSLRITGAAVPLAANSTPGTGGFPVVAGTVYTVAMVTNVLNLGSGRNWGFDVQWYTAAGAYMSTSTRSTSAIGGVNTLSQTLIAPANAAFALIRFVSDAGTGTLDAYVDSVQFVAESSRSAYFDGDTPGYQWEKAENLVTNPSFETNTAGWVGASGGVLSRSTSLFYVGSAAAKIAATNDAGTRANCDDIAVEAGATYSIQAQMYPHSGVSKSAQIVAVWMDASLVVITAPTITVDDPPLGAWTQVAGDLVAPAGAVLLEIRPTMNYVTAIDHEWFFDAVQVTEGSTAAYFDGDTPGGRWTGTAHASRSVKDGPPHASISEPQDATLTIDQLKLTPPRKRYDRVGSADADGTALVREPRYDDREVEVRLRVHPQADKDTALDHLAALTDKLQEADRMAVNGRGMELEWTPAESTRTVTLYVKGGEVEDLPIDFESGWLIGNSPTAALKLTCDPFLYGDEVTETAVTAALPLNTLTVADVAGDVPAEARLVVTDNATRPRDHVEFGLECYDYDPATDLLIDSAALATTGFAGTQTTRAGAYSSTGVVRATMAAVAVTVCSTGNQSHRGAFRAKARVYATGTTHVRLSYRVGDGPLAGLPFQTVQGTDNYFEVDLGTVTVPELELGAQRWVGQIDAYSDVPGSTLDVDYLMLFPDAEGYGKARRPLVWLPPASLSVYDGFDQHASTGLAGKVATAGGTWAGAGDADDFAVASAPLFTNLSNKEASRTAFSDSSLDNGRFAYVGTTNHAAVGAQVKLDVSVNAAAVDLRLHGLLLRYTDTSNWVVIGIDPTADTATTAVKVRKRVAGTSTNIASKVLSGIARDHLGGAGGKLAAVVDSTGRFAVWVEARDGTPGTPLLTGSDPVLATGGTLATGKVGIYDAATDAAAVAFPRGYDDLTVHPLVTDAAIFSGQSLEIRAEGKDVAVREDPTGNWWGRTNSYRGSRFWLPPAGDDGRPTRVAVATRRNDVDELPADNVTDSTTHQVIYRSRWVNAPFG